MLYPSYNEFNIDKLKCRLCEIGTIYKTVVQSIGNILDPIYMIIGEAPGKTEIEKGQPFCGRVGKLLREMLIKYGLTMKNTVITNVIPCRPLNNVFPSDKNLVAECMKRWLINEIEILNPKYMLLVGSTPMKYVIGSRGPITNIRGEIFNHINIVAPNGEDTFSDKYNKYIKCIPTFHPSYIIRNGTSEFGMFLRKQFEADIKKFKDLPLIETGNPTF